MSFFPHNSSEHPANSPLSASPSQAKAMDKSLINLNDRHLGRRDVNDLNNANEEVDGIQEILEEIHRGTFMNSTPNNSPDEECDNIIGKDETTIFDRLLKDAQRDLYPSSDLSLLSALVKILCAKTLRLDVLEKLEDMIVNTICQFEMIFPPAFFIIMVHLAVHLSREARLAGPVQYRWMYLIERNLSVHKGNVRNKARPEGLIVEAYVVNEMKNLNLHKSLEGNEDLYSLAMGPDICVNVHSGCIVNGVKFLVNQRDIRRVTQNSGVSVQGSDKDESIDFYGVLTNVVDLSYIDGNHVVLFKCKWFDLEHKKSIVIDDDFTSINMSKTWYDNDPYVLAGGLPIGEASPIADRPSLPHPSAPETKTTIIASSSNKKRGPTRDDCLLDLNFSPPLESGEGGSSPVLELKLGFE
ncbi:hypothetical protein KFK09_017657 [Dendrobium nobile]|uniref:DUF4218 domain-containing protein n=1 Tax=Dendrobium nobile TaxID=94219 RepID=A0A8T3B2Z0_DENNO|nr:hypothetical protein KFK09_017657 [Dendrobium nobile]